MTPTPRILVTLLAATAVALTSACADSGAGPGAAPKPPGLPAGQIVYQISEGGGFIAPDYALATPPAITIYGDGTVYRAVPPGREGPGAPWTFRIGHVSPARLARLVAEADRSGLFDGVDFGMPPISDVGGTTVRLRPGKGKAEHAYAYALDFTDADSNLTAAQLADRRSLRRLALRFAHAVHYRGSWTPTRVEVIDRQTGGSGSPVGASDHTGALPWPGPAPARLLTRTSSDGRCGVVDGSAAGSLFRAARDHASTHWTFHGADIYLLVRAVLPGERACAG